MSAKNKNADKKPKYWAIIPAAGVGKRMGGDRPKQYLLISKQTVLEHSLNRLLGCPEMEGAVVAISSGDEYWEDLNYHHEKIVLVATGGKERCDSVLSALQKISQIANDDDWVLVHDAARPCVRQEDIQKLIQSCRNHPVGGILAVPVKDTIKKSSVSAEMGMSESLPPEFCLPEIRETVDRSTLWHAQTPQMFRLGALRDALSKALDAGVEITDEASAIEWAGFHPLLVEGHADNIKITRQEDVNLALFYFDKMAEAQ
ncbi:MAG: 2-C-methyl-D-erythritol 4-phosphate cytidylyltransferase [Gammaproteobacteria bacterium]|nr:2-C-methyl-D-erythritol 4-phosphate cytidylyltransferase [Gammaproteobacteria bacterium]